MPLVGLTPLQIAGFFEALVALITDPVSLTIILIGVLVGMVMGAIPGLGGSITLTLLIPFTFGMDPVIALAFLSAARSATTFTGSITAILLNTPGSSSNMATLLDGYAMSQKGEAATAIGASAFGSAAGAIVGLAIFLLLLPVIQEVVILFGPAEFFLLAIVGIYAIAVAIRGAIIPGLIGGGLGFMAAFTGFNPITGSTRYTFDTAVLESGYPLIPALIGMFAIAEAIKLASQRDVIADTAGELEGSKLDGVREVFRHKLLFFQSSVIGFVIGAVPAIGGNVAGFVSYVQARNISKTPELFGTGHIEGIIASESANDSKDAGDLVPTLALGIPGSASAAILLGAFLIHGINPGPGFLINHLDVAFAIFAALLIGNVLTSTIGLVLADKVAELTRAPTPLIAVFIIAISLPGAYAMRNLTFDLFLALAFGLVGYMFVVANISRIAFIIALVLGPIAENSYHQALQIARGSHVDAFTSPISLILIVVFLGLFLLPIVTRRMNASPGADDA